MVPNAIAAELATRKMDSEIQRAAQHIVTRASIRPARRGPVDSVRNIVGVALIAAGRRIQGVHADRIIKPVTAGARP